MRENATGASYLCLGGAGGANDSEEEDAQAHEVDAFACLVRALGCGQGGRMRNEQVAKDERSV